MERPFSSSWSLFHCAGWMTRGPQELVIRCSVGKSDLSLAPVSVPPICADSMSIVCSKLWIYRMQKVHGVALRFRSRIVGRHLPYRTPWYTEETISGLMMSCHI